MIEKEIEITKKNGGGKERRQSEGRWWGKASDPSAKTPIPEKKTALGRQGGLDYPDRAFQV